MAIVLDGTAGITTPDVESSGPVSGTNFSYTGTLTGGTGVVNLGSGQFYKDASGNVGMGTSSPSRKLHLSAAGTDCAIRVDNTVSGRPFILTYDNSQNLTFTNSSDSGNISFVNGTGAGTERARIDSSGRLLVGTTGLLGIGFHEIRGNISGGGEAALMVTNSNASDAAPAINAIKSSSTTSSSARFVQFYAGLGGQPMGGIVGNGATNVQFASISDRREKTNISELNGSLAKVVALKPVEFDWIANGEHCPAGFVAQDVEQVFPEFVVENMADEGQEARKGLTGGMTGGIVAHLVKAIQELKAINDAQAQTINAQQTALESLTARVVALEGQA